MDEKKRKVNMVTSIIGLFVGAAFIAMGIVVYCEYASVWIYYEPYVGDFYTGIYNAVRELGDGISSLFYMIQMGLGTIMLLGGVLIELHFIKGIVYSKKVKEKDYSNKTYSKCLNDDNLLSKTNNIEEKRDISIDLEKLYELYTKGILTEEEFNTQKQRILK